MNTLHLNGRVSLSKIDVARCHSPAQVTYLRDLYAQKLVSGLGQDILNAGLVYEEENPRDDSLDLSINLHIIPIEYGNDVLRFAQDVVAAHQKQERLDSAG